MKKIKAFTIIELTVITLLSGIVISIAYFIFFIMEKQYNLYDKTSKYQLELSTLNRLLTQDFQIADSILTHDNSGIVVFKNSNKTLYIFAPPLITRNKNNQTDTFHLDVQDPTCLLDHTEVSVPNIWVDELMFTANYKQQKLRLHFYKKYAVAPFISKDNLNY